MARKTTTTLLNRADPKQRESSTAIASAFLPSPCCQSPQKPFASKRAQRTRSNQERTFINDDLVLVTAAHTPPSINRNAPGVKKWTVLQLQ
eukprot:m.117519 g.117519  ORF g.117519 m.117519 type:complete len:91 (-) comp15429_c0_seq3:818-1090(-)